MSGRILEVVPPGIWWSVQHCSGPPEMEEERARGNRREREGEGGMVVERWSTRELELCIGMYCI